MFIYPVAPLVRQPHYLTTIPYVLPTHVYVQSVAESIEIDNSYS